MLQTLFYIPRELFGVPLWVWLSVVWSIVAVVGLVRMAREAGWSRAIAENWFTVALTGAVIWLLPRLMEEKGLPIRGWGAMLLLAIATGVALSAYRARKIGFDPEIIFALAMWLIVSGIVGGRAFYVIQKWDQFQRGSLGETFVAIAGLTNGGMVVYGGLFAAGAALWYFIRKHHLPGLALCDLIAPGVVLGMAVGRIGCFFNGCCFGGECDLPWAVEFPWNSPPYVEQARQGELFLHGLRFKPQADAPPIIAEVEPDSDAFKQGLRPGNHVTSINGNKVADVETATFVLLEIYGEGKTLAIGIEGDSVKKSWQLHAPTEHSKPVHPTQLYSAIDAGLLCLFLLAYDPYRRREGELFALVLTIHPIARFLVEWIRIDEKEIWNTPYSISQNLSFVIFGAGVLVWIYLLTRPKGLWEPAGVRAG